MSEYSRLNKIGKENPFKLPKDYFDVFEEDLLSKIEKASFPPNEVKVHKTWVRRFYPWVSIAAVGAGIFFILNRFVFDSGNSTKIDPYKYAKEINLSSSKDIDAFYSYYEDQTVNSVYDDEIYKAESSLDKN